MPAPRWRPEWYEQAQLRDHSGAFDAYRGWQVSIASCTFGEFVEWWLRAPEVTFAAFRAFAATQGHPWKRIRITADGALVERPDGTMEHYLRANPPEPVSDARWLKARGWRAGSIDQYELCSRLLGGMAARRSAPAEVPPRAAQPRPARRPKSLGARVVAVLDNRPAERLSARDIASRLAAESVAPSPPSLQVTLSRLTQAGRIQRVDRGLYASVVEVPA